MVYIPRLSRKDVKTPFLHIMIQGMNREYIFKDKKHIETYLSLLRKYYKDYELTIIAYCIMNNHAHLLIYAEKIQELSSYMHKVNLIYSQFYNKTNKRCGMVFRNRFKAEPIYNLEYLINCIQYIHLNPVKARIVKKCEDYPYSSYNQYINNGPITKSKIMVEIFGEKCDYSKMFDNRIKYMFIDVKKPGEEEIRQIMDTAINDFIQSNDIQIVDILSNTNVLNNVVKDLKEIYNFRYTDIMNRFNISNMLMQKIKIMQSYKSNN